MSRLDDLRARIDEIDAQMVALFEQRMNVTRQVGEYKRENDLPVLDQKREQEVLAKKQALLKNKYLKSEVKDFFATVMELSRRQQRNLMAENTPAAAFAAYQALRKSARAPLENPRVLYQGEPGAYAEEAAALFFGEKVQRDHRDTWRALFAALKDGAADYIVVPIENNSTGSINTVYDLLAEFGAYVCGEQTLRVRHCLAALPGARMEEITDVYSHEQGFFQSGDYLSSHAAWRRNAVLNTAAAAKMVSQSGDRTKAAICSRRAAEEYGLHILAEDIATSADNFTRFFIVSSQMERRPGSDKISLMFTLPHESGTLNRILGIFALHHLNMLRLESRPILGKGWEYRFFVDVQGDLDDSEMDTILYEVMENTLTLRILGGYVRGA